MKTKLMHVHFQGEDIFLVEHEGEPYVPVKRVCEALGIDVRKQMHKLQGSRFQVCTIRGIPSAGGAQKMLCLPLAKLAGWLMTINPEKVRAEVKPKLLAYQDECTGALRDYWDKGRAENPRFAQNGHGQNGHGQNGHAFDKKYILSLPGRPPFMLAKDLAEVYEVNSKRIAEVVRRNPEHFPEDFVFELADKEKESLQNEGSLSQQAALNKVRGFTRNGANMLAVLLTNKVAAQHRMQIMRGLGDWEEVAQNGHASDKKHAQTIYSDEPVVVLAMSEYADLQEERAELWRFKAQTLENAGGRPNERLV